MFAQVISPLIRGYKFQKNPIEFFDDVQRRYGDLAKLSFPGKKIVFAFHPRHAEHVLKSAKDRYGKNRDVLHAILDLSGDTGLIQMTDEEAVKLRGAVMPLFRRPFLDEIPKYVASVCDELFADLDEAARLELPVDLRPFLTRLVLDVAGFVVLGVPRLEKSLAMHASFSRLNYLAGLRLRSPLHGTRGGKRREAK
jgi:cytochrome P450